jgi:hypothetical protein
MKAKKSTTAAAAIVLAGGSLAALAATRRWHQHWGATDEEIARPLPGDDLIPNSKLDSTHAITIHAPAERIWPWLAQMGYDDRAGSYSYACSSGPSAATSTGSTQTSHRWPLGAPCRSIRTRR